MKSVAEIKMVSVEKLIPYARNARTHSDQQVSQIASSIKEFGFNNPILIKDDFTVIAGHGRLAAATKLGLMEVPAISLSHLTPTQVKAYILADNKLALNAGWDEEMLALEIQELDLEGFDVSLAGFDTDEVSKLLAQSTPEGMTDEDDAPEPPEEPKTRLGDVWLLGKHRVMCGDSMMIDSVEHLMEKKNANLIFTDPPYGVSFKSNMSDRFDVLKNDDKFLDIAPIVWKFLEDDSASFIWTSHQVYVEWRKQFDSFYKQTIIWSKGGGGMGDLFGQYALNYEMALFCCKGSPKFRKDRGMAVWEIKKDSASKYVHPTQKPIELCEIAINDFSDKNGIVLDLFGGSGSTLIACEKNGRINRSMELDTKYVDVIVQRWQNFTGKVATLESDGSAFPIPPNPTQPK